MDLNTTEQSLIPIPENILEKRFSSDFVFYKNEFYAITNEYLTNITQHKNLINFTIPESDDPSLFNKINTDDFFNVKSPLRKFISNDTELLFYEFDRKNHILNIRNAVSGAYLKQFSKVSQVFFPKTNELSFLNSEENTISTIDLKNFNSISSIKVNAKLDNVYKFKFNSKKNKMALKYDKYGRDISIVHLESNEYLPIKPKSMHVDSFVFSPNNKYLLTGNRYGEIEIWDVNDGSFIGQLFSGSLNNDYVIAVDQFYDGTVKGIENFLNCTKMTSLQKKPGLLKTTLFD